MKIIAIIQCRLTSQRLPGKVLIPIAGKPSLQWIVERVRQAKQVDDIMVATTWKQKDLPIVRFSTDKLKCLCYRGEPEDVLKRVVEAGYSYPTSQEVAVVDITGDCPLVDPAHIDYLVTWFKKDKMDYVSNVVQRSWCDGADIQVYKLSVLEQVEKIVDKNTPHSCHTGWNILKYKECLGDIKIGGWSAPAGEYYPDWGLTLDTEEDLELIDTILKHFIKQKIMYPSISQIIEYIKSNMKLLEINNSVRRKTPGEG
jgi:spore coat polysaccharide biosynthesis protein SpsF